MQYQKFNPRIHTAKELIITGISGSLFIVLGSVAFGAIIWGCLALVFWGYVWWQTWRRRELNRADHDSPCFLHFGWANRLTLLRGWLIALTGGFLFQASLVGIVAWLPGTLYGIAAILDRVDGSVAQRSGTISLLGKQLDTEMDALGLLIAPLLAVICGKFHWSFLAVSAAYYIFIAGLNWRKYKNLPVFPLPSSALRRTLAGFQMGFASLALLPAFSTEITRCLGVIFMIPILMGFLVDWFAVCGHKWTQILRANLSAWSNTILQPLLRLIITVTIFIKLFSNSPLSALQAILFSVLAIALLAGIAARTAAGTLLIIWSIQSGDHLLMGSDIIKFAVVSAILLLGAGKFSLWRADDRWIEHA